MTHVNDYLLARPKLGELGYTSAAVALIDTVRAQVRGMSTHPSALYLRGVWSEYETVFSHQGILPDGDLVELDNHPDHVKMIPGWKPLTNVICKNDQMSEWEAYVKLLSVWDARREYHVEVSEWLHLIRSVLSENYEVSLHSAYYPILRIGAALPYTWADHVQKRCPETVEIAFNRILRRKGDPSYSVASGGMRNFLIRLVDGVTVLADGNQYEDGYYVLQKGLTILHALHMAALFSKYRATPTAEDRRAISVADTALIRFIENCVRCNKHMHEEVHRG